MRPLLLKMTAFGPYKHTETIDFTRLEDHTLFMISGQTGAGKTTIFDGICFALYGSASGSDRDQISMLRSDFADDDTHTAVELTFELKGKVYRILRQLGHIKQGNKTKTGDRYEFYEIVGDTEIPCVDRQIVSEINQKVEDLIGLTQEQFKQIVMLPQGEFRKLLTSDTQNKEAVLRRLFKTENYQQINEKAKERKDQLEHELMKAKQTYEHSIQHIYASLQKREQSFLFQVLAADHYNANQILAGLGEEISFYEKEINLNQTAYDRAYTIHDRKQEELHKANALNERFDELAEKEKQLQTLKNELPNIKFKEKQLKEAERAKRIDVYEKHVDEWTVDERNKKHAFKEAEAFLNKVERELQQAEAVYKEEKNKQSKRDELAKRLDRFIDFRPVVQQIEEEKQQLVQLKSDMDQTESKLQQTEQTFKETKVMLEDDTKKLQQIDESVRSLTDKKIQRNKMREQVRTLQKYVQLEKQQTINQKDMAVKESKWHEQKQVYEQLEHVWLNHQASLLASHLHDGEACPVCGSLHHPNKATYEGNHVTREQLNQLKSQVDERYQELQNVRATYKANADQLTELKRDLLNLEINTAEAEQALQSLTEAGMTLAHEIKELEKRNEERDSLKQKIDKRQESLHRLEKDKDQLGQQLYQLKAEYQSKQAVQHEKLRKIPEEMRNLNQLEKYIVETKTAKEKMIARWERAQKQHEQAKETYTRAVSDKSNVQKSWKEAQLKRQKAEELFMNALKKAKFETIADYRQAKMDEQALESLQIDIEQFKHRLSTLTEQVAELKDYLQDKKRVNVTALQAELKQLKEQYEFALKRLNASKDFHQEAQRLKSTIINNYQNMVELEQKLSVMTDLYDVLRGQNEQKMSFERYLQIEYLEQIIDAANHRLKDLSHGQFLLWRSDRQESHGRQSGLALDVYDSYTGQMRDVKTLSGGEKFNASLCLALGMSDVIQSFQGNISIDTMFIDEGFGSLDEESLNKSVETLLDIQESGRMIGIISHVQELKQMFSAVLEVKKTTEGYSQTTFLLK